MLHLGCEDTPPRQQTLRTPPASRSPHMMTIRMRTILWRRLGWRSRLGLHTMAREPGLVWKSTVFVRCRNVRDSAVAGAEAQIGLPREWAVSCGLPQTASLSVSVYSSDAVTFATAWCERLTHFFSRYGRTTALTKIIDSQRKNWGLSNVFLSGHHLGAYFSLLTLLPCSPAP